MSENLSKKNLKIWTTYKQKLADIRCMVNELSTIIDLDSYKNNIDQLETNANNAFSSLDGSFDKKTINSCIYVLDYLKKELDSKYYNYYQMLVFKGKIESNLKEKEEGIDDAIKNSIILLDYLSKCDNVDKEFKELFDSCVRVIYNVVIEEQIYDRTKFIEEINKNSNYKKIKNILTNLLIKDLVSIDLDDELQLSNFDSGESGNVFNDEKVYHIIEKKYLEEKNEYRSRRDKAIRSLKEKLSNYQSEKAELDNDKEDNNIKIAKIRISKAFNTTKLLSFIIVPTLLIYGGYRLGVNMSNKIDEYRTITRVVDPITSEVVETISDTYEEKEYSYASTLKVYEPWQKATNENQYERNIIAYVTDESNNSTGIIKYLYTEVKPELDKNDSTTETLTLLTETIQDKNDSVKSRKYVVWFPVIGGILSAFIDFLLAKGMGVSDIMSVLDSLDSNLRGQKRRRRTIRGKYQDLQSYLKEFNLEYGEYKKIYQLDSRYIKVNKKA